MNTHIRFALMNYKAGGLVRPGDEALLSNRGHWDFSGLRDAFIGMLDAPDVIVVCEAKEFGLWGGKGLSFAASVFDRIFERPYVGKLGWMQQGLSGPALFYDPTRLRLDFFGDLDPTVHLERRNIAAMHLRAHPELKFEVLMDHWAYWSGALRLDRAKMLGRNGTRDRKMLWLGDFNCVPSGDHWPQRAWSVLDASDASDKGRRTAEGTWEADTEAMDHLLGRWVRYEGSVGRRVGGVGFHAIPELAWLQGMPLDKAMLPTVDRRVDKGGGLLVDFGIVNDAWRNGLVHDTFHIDHPPTEDGGLVNLSDHKRSAWVLDAAA